MYPVTRFLLRTLAIVCILLIPVSIVCFVGFLSDATGTKTAEIKAEARLGAMVSAGAFVGSIVTLIYCDVARAILHTSRNTELLLKFLTEQNAGLTDKGSMTAARAPVAGSEPAEETSETLGRRRKGAGSRVED